jgi:hypothetical protein
VNSQYTIRRQPDASAFRRLQKRLEETEVQPPAALLNAGRSRTLWTPANADAITEAEKRQPWRRSRHIARKSGVSQTGFL